VVAGRNRAFDHRCRVVRCYDGRRRYQVCRYMSCVTSRELCRSTCCVTSSGGSSVLVDEASEAVVAHAGDGERRLDGLAQGVGRELSAGSEMANSQASPPRLGGCLPVRWLQRT